MNENSIIDGAFYLLEKDSDPWDTADDEYSTARGFLNIGVRRWEKYENTTWRELWTRLADAPDGDTTVSASTWVYDTPTDFVRPGGYVTTTSSDGGVKFYRVINTEDYTKYADSTGDFAFFTGNKKTGFDLNFNPQTTLTTGATIDYPYYKSASTSSASSTVLEMGDPNFLSYFIAAHMSESSDSVDQDFFAVAEGLLKQMKSVNNSGVWGNPFNIEPNLEEYSGFGTGDVSVISSGNPTGR